MDETVVGAAPARWTTAGMKREDGMQGSRSEGVDERGRSLVMDGGGRRRVGWRGCFGAHGVRMGKREVERKGGTTYSGHACLKCKEIYKLSPRFKFLLHHSMSVGDRTVISHTPNICRREFVFGAHRV